MHSPSWAVALETVQWVPVQVRLSLAAHTDGTSTEKVASKMKRDMKWQSEFQSARPCPLKLIATARADAVMCCGVGAKPFLALCS